MSTIYENHMCVSYKVRIHVVRSASVWHGSYAPVCNARNTNKLYQVYTTYECHI